MKNLTLQVKRKGVCKIHNKFYKFENRDLFDFQESYFRLPKDQSHGERYRAYSKYKYINGQLSLAKADLYVQSKKYNNEEGGKPRKFESIEDKVLSGNLLKNIINQDTAIAKLTNEVNFCEKN